MQGHRDGDGDIRTEEQGHKEQYRDRDGDGARDRGMGKEPTKLKV